MAHSLLLAVFQWHANPNFMGFRFVLNQLEAMLHVMYIAAMNFSFKCCNHGHVFVVT